MVEEDEEQVVQNYRRKQRKFEINQQFAEKMKQQLQATEDQKDFIDSLSRDQLNKIEL